jgi:hypothetical protein
MPNSFSRFAVYLSILIFAVSVVKLEWVVWHVYFAMTSVVILIWYNLYLFFRNIYVTKNWHVKKPLTRALGKLSGLYVGAGMAAFMAMAISSPEFSDLEGIEEITRLQILFGGVFFFFGGVIMFYCMAFFFKFGLRYIMWPRPFDF